MDSVPVAARTRSCWHSRLGGIALLLVASAAVASEQEMPRRGSRIAVVAVHDSRLLTLCPTLAVVGQDVVLSLGWTHQNDGKTLVSYPPVLDVQHIGFYLDPDRRTTVTLPIPAAGATAVGGAPPRPVVVRLDRLAHDAEVQLRVEAEFRARGRYTVVASPDAADFVFLTESIYVPWTTLGAEAPPVPASETPRRPSGMPRIFTEAESEWNRTHIQVVSSDRRRPGDMTPVTSSPGLLPGADRTATLRSTIIGLVVPSTAYARHVGDGAGLVAASVWRGVAAWWFGRSNLGGELMRPASPEALVDEFYGTKPKGEDTNPALRLPSHLPACAASAEPIRTIRESGDGLATPGGRTPPAKTTTDELPTRQFWTGMRLVKIPVSVTDGNGEPVARLAPSAVRVFEDDAEQSIEAFDLGTRSVELAVLVDTSESMSGPIETLRLASERFVGAIRPEDRVQILSFDTGVRVAQELTANQADLRYALTNLRPGGGTRLYDALALIAVDRLGRDARQAIVLLTDGRDTRSQLTDATGALTALEATNAPVFVIQYQTAERRDPAAGLPPPVREWLVLPANPESDPGTVANQNVFLHRLATETGGRMYIAGADADPGEIVAHIANELSSQLVLGYHSTNPTLDGGYRRIRVTVDGVGYTVRARAGYRAGALLGAR